MGQTMSAAGGRSERAEDEARGVTLGIGGGFEPGRVDAPPAGISGRRGESGRGNSLLELGDCDAHVETTSDATARPGTLRGVAGAARGDITSQKREILTADIKQPGRNGKSLEQDKFFFIHQATLGRMSPLPFIYLAGSPSLDADAFFDFSPTDPPTPFFSRSGARCDRPSRAAAAAAAALRSATATFALSIDDPW